MIEVEKAKVIVYESSIVPAFRLFVVRGGCEEDIRNTFKDIEGGEIEPFKTTEDGKAKFSALTTKVSVRHSGEIGVLVWVVKSVGISEVCHEAVHAADMMFGMIGQELDVENDEMYAYLVGWIAKNIYENVN